LGTQETKDTGYTAPHDDYLTTSSTLFAVAGIGVAGNKYFLGWGLQYKPILPITHEKMILDDMATKLRASQGLKYGSNAMGGVGYGLTLISYTESFIKEDYRNARKYGVDGFYGALMFAWPVGTLSVVSGCM
jgi:hypothetical protein